MPKQMKVMMIGDGESQLDIVRTILEGTGHQVLGASSPMHQGSMESLLEGKVSGTLAPVMFAEYRPDLVILDLDAEDSGSFGTIEAVRRMEDNRWVPIWCLGTTGASELEQTIALECGADAYLGRPVSIPLLKARISQMQRYFNRQRQFTRRADTLQDYFETVEGEIKSARMVMDGLLRTSSDASQVLQSWIAPAFKFSGDAMLAERSPDGSLKLLLADGVGHGLPAALNVLPVCRAFQSMAQKGFGLPSLVTELNQTIRRHLPSHRFVATTLVNIDASAGIIEVWNGGNPAALMMDAMGEVVDVWSSQHLPLGVVDADELDPRPDVRPLCPDGELVLYSDGAIEVLNERGEAFGEAALIRTLAEAPPGVRLEALKFAVVEHLAGRPANDDVTLALFDCAAELKQGGARRAVDPREEPENDVLPPQANSGPWEISVTVEKRRLAELDLMPLLRDFINRFDPSWPAGTELCRQLADSLVERFEQGLLKLDPQLKQASDGLRLYAEARERAMLEIDEGAVRISIRRNTLTGCMEVDMHEAILLPNLPGEAPVEARGEEPARWDERHEATIRLPLLDHLRETVHPRPSSAH